MDTASLQKQFSELQEEQHQRLTRMKLKQAAQLAKDSTEDSSFYGLSDDLNLNVTDLSTSASVGLNVTLEAANTKMREELRELQDETGRLRKVLAERDYEIKRLNKKVLKCEEEKRILADSGIASDSASTKIVELSKKNRDLTSQMESEKSKCFRFQQKVIELERKLMNSTLDTARSESKSTKSLSVRQSLPSLTPESIESLQDQLNSANLKVSEYRNQIQALKQDMKVALKVLSQETGENQVTLQALIATNGQGFRGRAQQVIALQNKVKELEQKLKSDLDLNPKVDKNFQRIKNMERSRKEQIDSLKEDLMKLQEQYSESQRKLEGSKARNKVLVSEVKSLKSQLSVLTDKGTHDNELIETLMRQQENLQKLLQRNAVDQGSVTKNESMMKKELHDLRQQESAEVKRLKELLSERDARVRELEEKQVNVSDSLDEKYKPLSVFSSSTQLVNETTASPEQNSDLQALMRKCAELEALYEASETERQQLTRMVTSLNFRIEESAKKYQQVLSNFHEEKRKCLSLEQQLETLGSSKSDAALSSRENVSKGHVRELEAQLQIQKDENFALKEALDSTLRGKQNDVTIYQEMAEQTKQVFLDALRSFNSKSHT